MSLSVIILIIVYILIAVRQIGHVRLQIWQIMGGGALAVLLTGKISPMDALSAIDVDVMLFLFGMFVMGRALEESGYLSYLAYKIFRRARSMDSLVLLILFGVGIASAFLMNDTLAIMGTPVVLLLAKQHQVHPQVLLLALAFAVTVGSVMSPIGNPQNLLIAINGNITDPFIIFLKLLLLPTLLNLFLAYVLLKFVYKEKFHNNQLNHSEEPLKDARLSALSKISLLIMVLLVAAKITASFLGKGNFRLTYIALISALPIVIFSPKRWSIIRNIDWHTLIFFAAMFVLMESVWHSGFFQSIFDHLNMDINSIPMIITMSILVSQLISNVPWVALFLPMLMHAGGSTLEIIALAAGGTIAGNLFILGAASNVIIIQSAERKSGETIGFSEFARIGIPLTLMNALVYWFFLEVM